jgi:hypothetical protein
MYRVTGDQKYRDWGWEIAQVLPRFSLSKNSQLNIYMIRIYFYKYTQSQFSLMDDVF